VDSHELRDLLAESERTYEAGIELIVAGDELGGEERIAEATRGLREVAERCAAIEGCDLAVYLDAIDRVLARQGLALKTQAARIGELEAGAAEDAEREPGTTPFVAAMPEIAKSVSLLRGTDLRQIIELNGPVSTAIEDWLTWMRPDLMEAWENYQYLRPKIAPIYEEAGLPEALLFAMLATESGGKAHAQSRAGAAGLMQFMRSTGQQYGLRTEQGFDMRLDPEASVRASVAYLNDRFRELNDSLENALASYNGGESRMRGLQKRSAGKSFWDGRIYHALPRETREYVPRVLAAAWLFLHPDDYNLVLPYLEVETTELTLRGEITLGELAICLGQEAEAERGWFRTLRNLNPRLTPNDRIPQGTTIEVPVRLVPAYEQRCLEGAILERARALHDSGHREPPPMITYRVRSGDTLARIASRHACVTLQELAAINGIRPPRYTIREGQTLKLPSCS
jgi:membrane-bound lytic murein transglycosylase D